MKPTFEKFLEASAGPTVLAMSPGEHERYVTLVRDVYEDLPEQEVLALMEEMEWWKARRLERENSNAKAPSNM